MIRILKLIVIGLFMLVVTSGLSWSQQEGSENASKPEQRIGPFVLLSKAKISSRPSEEIRQAAKEESVQDQSEEGYLPNPTAIDCFDALGYRYTGGRYHNDLIRLRLRCPPKIKPGRKYPLIVWFHGKAESGDDNERQLGHVQYTLPLLAGPRSLNFFILATQCPKDNRLWTTSVSKDDPKGDAPITIAREIMEAVIDAFPIDKDRISAFGLSSGGSAAWQFVMDSPEKFSCLTVCSANEPVRRPLTDMNVWVFGCTGDKGISIESIRKSIARINNEGGSALLTEVDSTFHDSWSTALNNKKVVAWMIAQKRGSMAGPPPGVIVDGRTWTKSFVYFGLPVCCMLPFLVVWKRKGK